jgi:hypothetical protein
MVRVLLSFVFAIGVFSAAFAQKMEPNSYFIRPARNHDSLMNQIRNERVVMDRYMRHFAMTRDEVIAYFRTLTLARLQQEAVYPVFNVPAESGVMTKRYLRLRRGTLVWVDLVGVPILKESCGNPLTLGPKRPAAKQKARAAGGLEGLAEIDVEDAEPEVAETWQGTITPLTPGLDAYFVGPEYEGAGLAPTGAPSLMPSGFGGDWGWLAGLLLLAGLDHASAGGVPPPIPEPATVAALGIGLAWLARRRRAER